MRKGLIMAGLCLLAVCSGCGTKITSENRQKVTSLDWYINFSWYTTTWGGNEVSDAITDATGVSVNFIAPKGNETEKMDAMIASDTLPDLVTLGWWSDECEKMIREGQVYALNELADEYAPEFYDVANPATLSWYTKQDGNIYCYPNSSCTPEDLDKYENLSSNQNFLVRKDIYEALECPDMSTQKGFADAVKKAAEIYPEVDGQPLIPIGADEFTEKGCNSFGLYLQDFLAVPYEKDGKYYERSTDPDYLSWLKVFRQLGQEGYLKDDIFIDKRSQLEEKIAEGRYFCLFYQSSDITDQQKILNSTHPERCYIAVDGPRNLSGDNPVLPVVGVNGWTITFISKNCKDPKAAIEFLTYLMGEEGQKMTYLGVEGSMYEMKDGKPVEKQEVLDLLNSDRDAYDKKYGADNTYWMMQNNVMQLEWNFNPEDATGQMKEWTYPYTAYTGQYDLNFTNSEEGKNLKIRKEKIWGETLTELLLASSDEEFYRILEECKEKWKNAGYEKFCELATEEIRNNKIRLGMADE